MEQAISIVKDDVTYTDVDVTELDVPEKSCNECKWFRPEYMLDSPMLWGYCVWCETHPMPAVYVDDTLFQGTDDLDCPCWEAKDAA